MYYTSEVLKNPAENSAARHLAGILFKNTVLNTTKDIQCVALWAQMQENERDTLKNSLIETLGDQDKAVIRAAGSCIAAIASLDIPAGQWNNLIEYLCGYIQHDLENIRQASLLTLGYI